MYRHTTEGTADTLHNTHGATNTLQRELPISDRGHYQHSTAGATDKRQRALPTRYSGSYRPATEDTTDTIQRDAIDNRHGATDRQQKALPYQSYVHIIIGSSLDRSVRWRDMRVVYI